MHDTRTNDCHQLLSAVYHLNKDISEDFMPSPPHAPGNTARIARSTLGGGSSIVNTSTVIQ